MICACGAMDLVLRRDMQQVSVFLASGVATVRLPDIMRIEHLNCGTCTGLVLGEYDPYLNGGDCGCGRNYNGPRPEPLPDHLLPKIEGVVGEPHTCPCGAFEWEAVRDGSLALTGTGVAYVWAEDDAVIVRRVYCHRCGWVLQTEDVVQAQT